MLNWLETNLELNLLDLYDTEIISVIEKNFSKIYCFEELLHKERFILIQTNYNENPKETALILWNEIRQSPVNSILYRCILKFLSLGN